MSMRYKQKNHSRMKRISRTKKRIMAFSIWLIGVLIFLAFSYYNISWSREDAEDRLISEAGRTAAQLAALLSVPGWNMDEGAARAVVSGAMEDDHIYAVRVKSLDGKVEGQRRNYLWEPIKWDDEITENSVQGMNLVKNGAELIGQVDVWLSSRLNEEEDSILVKREIFRFSCFFILWTLTLLLVLWQWGELRRLRLYLFSQDAGTGDNTEHTEKLFQDLNKRENEDNAASFTDENNPPVSAEKGLRYQRLHPDSFRVTAGMFRQTFARGPALIGRLYADGEIAGLCHLGRMLEQAAPCIGADELAQAANEMQKALNDPGCDAKAIPVEECARILEEVLSALCGNGQWRSRPDKHRS